MFENTGEILNVRTKNSSTGIVLGSWCDNSSDGFFFLVWNVFHRKNFSSSSRYLVSIIPVSLHLLLISWSSLLFHLLSSYNTQKRNKPDKWLHQRRTAMHHERESCHICQSLPTESIKYQSRSELLKIVEDSPSWAGGRSKNVFHNTCTHLCVSLQSRIAAWQGPSTQNSRGFDRERASLQSCSLIQGHKILLRQTRNCLCSVISESEPSTDSRS